MVKAILVSSGSEGWAEVSEASLEILIQESVEDRIEAAVGIAECNTQVPAGNHKGVLLVDVYKCFDNDEDVDRCPADNEGGHHYQDHSSDSTHVSVLLL